MILGLVLNLLLYLPTLSLSSTKEIDSNIYYYANHYTKNNNDFIIKQHVANNMADSGGASIYMIQTPDEKFVIKLEKPGKIEHEVKALTQLKEENLTPKLMGQAEFTNNQEDRVGVLIESFIEGDSLHSYLEKVGQSSNPFSRWIHQIKLNRALKSIAKKLCYFHRMQSHPVHNDLHPGNIFYHAESDTATLIDLELTSFSKQRPEEDISYFLLTFEMYASKYNLNKNTISAQQQTFLEHYKNPLDKELMKKYRFLQIEEFKEHFDKNGCYEEKLLLSYLYTI